MANYIKLTFNQDLIAGDVIRIFGENFALATPLFPYIETWQDTPRTGAGQIQVTNPTGTPGDAPALAYGVFFGIDYNGTGLWIVSLSGNVVTITSTNQDIGFTSFEVPASVDVEIFNEPIIPPFEITDATFSTADVPCDYVKFTVTTNEVVDYYTINGSQIDNTAQDNPLVIDMPRGVASVLLFYNANGDYISYPAGITESQIPISAADSLVRPIQLNENSFDITIYQSISGATVLADQIGAYIPTPILQYSLDGVNYQPGNSFTGQANGNYTMYIQDQFGCVGQIDYTVTDVPTRAPYLFYSKALSVGFTEQVEWDNCSIFKNEDNTLNSQAITNINYCDNILFQNCDTTRIQFKSNYPVISVTLRKEDLTETPIPITQQTSNLSRFQNMDCWLYNYNESQTGIYFLAGNTYDEYDVATGTYTLNGNLPDMAIIGNIIDLGSYGAYTISDIVYDSTLNVKAILIDAQLDVTPAITWRVKSIFDLLPFDVFEFEVNWAVHGNGVYDILIENSNDTETIQHLSENIIVDDTQENTLAIRYYNDNNRDVFYKYGIEHFIRVPFLDFRAGIEDEEELNITDFATEVVKSTVNETNEIVFDELSVSMFRKLSIALSCKTVFINGIGYAKTGQIQYENVPNTNLISMSVKMIKTNLNFTTNRQGQTGADVEDIDFNIPAFITNDDTFIVE